MYLSRGIRYDHRSLCQVVAFFMVFLSGIVMARGAVARPDTSDTISAVANASTRLQDTRLQARIVYYRHLLSDSATDKVLKLACYDSLVDLYGRVGAMQDRYEFQKDKIVFLQSIGGFAMAMQACRDMLSEQEEKRLKTSEDSLRYAETKLKLGILSITTADYEEGTATLMDLLYMSVPDWIRLQAYSYLGYIFMRNQRLSESAEYHRKALDVFERMPEGEVKESQRHILYNHLAGLYYSSEVYDSAIYFLEKAVESPSVDLSQKAFVYHNMALIYMDIGESAMAKEYLERVIRMGKKGKSLYMQASAMQNLAFIYVKENQLEQAERLYLEAMRITQRIQANGLLADIMIEYADILFRTGRYKAFKEIYTAGIAKRDSVAGALNREKMDLLNYKYEAYKVASEKKILEQSLALTQLANQKKTFVLAGLGLLTVFLTVLMLWMIRKIRLQAEERVDTASSLESRNRELAARTLYLVRVNEAMRDAVKGLQEAEALNRLEEKNEKIRQVRNSIRKFDGKMEGGWKDFKLYFEQMHRDFYTNLTRMAPELSPVEQRLCALLASNLTTKEIAEITNRSVRTIETMIYRIRKKFQLPSDVKMPLFLQKFL